MATLSKNLRYLMDKYYLCEIDLARLAKIPQPTIHHIISGTTKKPRRKTLEALAKAFAISINELIGVEKLSCLPKPRHEENLITEIKLLRKEIAEFKLDLQERKSFKNS